MTSRMQLKWYVLSMRIHTHIYICDVLLYAGIQLYSLTTNGGTILKKEKYRDSGDEAKD